MHQNVSLVFITLAAGIGIPIMATLNSTLGTRMESPALAAGILFLVALFITIAVVLIQSPTISFSKVNLPFPYYMGGVFVAFYVLSITWVAPKLGVSNAIFIILLGQILAAVIIEHFALFNAEKISLSFTRVGGVLLMVLGIFLARK